MKPPLTTEARPTPRTEEAIQTFNDQCDTPVAAHFAATLELELAFYQRSNQVLTEALEESERLRKLSVVLVADFHALRASEERLADAVKDILHDLPTVECSNFHHASKDHHMGFDCPCYDRWQAATVAANKALAQRPTP